MKEWDVNIYRGILTGYNEAFIINQETRDKLIAASSKNDEIIRPILRGRDIKKYDIHFSNLYLINAHNGVKEKGTKRIDVVNDYPVIYEHLKHFQSKLESRSDKGDHWSNLRNCAYIDIFTGPKLIYPETMRLLKNN
ncbi:type II restriction endonuclease, partial [Flavobacterium silvisoli]